MTSLAELIQTRLKDLGISKAQLAEKLNVSRSYVVNMANQTGNTKSGQYRPSPEVVSKLSKALEVSENEILRAVGYLSDDQPNISEIADEEFAALFYDSRNWDAETRVDALEMAKDVFRRYQARAKREKENGNK